MDEHPQNTPIPDTGRFGRIALQLGFITQEQLDEALKLQTLAAQAGLPRRLGDILVIKGYITADHVQQILAGQVSRKRIGQYELISKLGEGATGAVFKARQIYADRIVALKILSSKMARNQIFRDRFVREARAVAQLNHPHIIAGIDVGSADGYCYFAMEYVDGETVGQYMKRKGGKLEEPVALDFMRQSALALHHAHENNMLHRDVKPDNLLLDGTRSSVKLADLGLVRSADGLPEDASITKAGETLGTPYYISPEQARGRTDLTFAADLYSLGATFFHVLAGVPPFEGTTGAVIMTRHLTDEAPLIRTLAPSVSLATEMILCKLLQKEPKDRYASAMALAADIERAQSGQLLDGQQKPAGPKSSKLFIPWAIAESSQTADSASPANSVNPDDAASQQNEAKRNVAGGVALCILIVGIIAVWLLVNQSAQKPMQPSTGENPDSTQANTPVTKPAAK